MIRMADRLVLLDVNKLLVKDTRDVSEYITEAIQSRYSFRPEVNADEYEGWSAQQMLRDILEKNGISKDDIENKLEGCAEELGYSYFNVTGREAITTMNGARQLVDELTKKGAIVGIATGEVGSQVKNRLDRAGLSQLFKFGEYGDHHEELKDIVSGAIAKARGQGYAGGQVWVICTSPIMVKAAKAAGANAIGVAGGRYGTDELDTAGASVTVQGIKDRSKIVKAIFG